MRLSQTKQTEIAEKIKKDMYDKPFAAIDKEQKDLVYENYLLWVAPYQDIVNQLPTEMVCRDDHIKMDVVEHVTWNYYHNSKLVNLVTGSGWSTSSHSIPLQKELEPAAMTLLDKEKDLTSEKNELMDYVNESMHTLGTTLKLRKTWPHALHKYIPAEPLRKSKKTKEVQEELFAAPTDAIKQRMTENLLEG
jgi:hypothetical protein